MMGAGSNYGTNLLQQSFRSHGAGRSSSLPLTPSGLVHSRSFSTTATRSALSSPSLDSNGLLGDDETSALSSPLMSDLPDFSGFSGFGRGVPQVPNDSFGAVEMPMHIQSLVQDVSVLKGDIRTVNSALERVEEALKNPASPNEAPWIRQAAELFHSQQPILDKSPGLTKLKEQFPDVQYWLPGDFSANNDSVSRTLGKKKSAGGTDRKNDINNDGLYCERADGTIIGGQEFSNIREYLNTLLLDIFAAGKATRNLAHLGAHIRGALIFMLEMRYPYLVLCVDNWKAKLVIQGRYRYWAKPFHKQLITYEDDADADDASKRPGSPIENDNNKRQRVLDDPSLSTIATPPTTTVPSTTESRPTNPELESATNIRPPAAAAATVVSSPDTNTPGPESMVATHLQMPPTDLFAGIVVDPPPPPTDQTEPHTAPALPLNEQMDIGPAPPPPVNASAKSNKKPCKPHAKALTPRNLYLVVYHDRVSGTEAEFKAAWSQMETEDRGRYDAYERYSKELKEITPKPVPPAPADVEARIAALLEETLNT